MNDDLSNIALVLMRLGGKVAALQFAMGAVLATHPDKQRILKMWDEYLPERINEWMETPEYQSEPFREELNNALGDTRRLLELAIEVDDEGN